ncbi:hypothetical protein [Rathayibacter toxicus]|uniref:MafI family immunity protein n=1 Tax=Rathayibacter toxicus TaxID=145458 RepID=A0A2S5Y4G5_9MICO|nr:hypothetical protein [Rathayibacter toxicus]PPH22998.1 hypothetical protein C5D17_06920 [Rathayibacter toxicus]PPH57210.1 hypothetical protein C5D30_06915 [Rathayibacter toxicus]PPH59716.1 hypothetical protein C5C93_06950 [Rathayibacter toxicus]PPH86983.1 hypothetical protein C5D31_06955 [Rathayibacter toxicus]PPI13246.1 hypothetical protein C5C51_10640 [Rathayibacter toxicus]
MNDVIIDPFDAGLLQLIADLEGLLSPEAMFHAREDVKYGEYQVCVEGIISSLECSDHLIPAEILNRLIEYSIAVNLEEDACKDIRSE